jgi:hypothetical protein
VITVFVVVVTGDPPGVLLGVVVVDVSVIGVPFLRPVTTAVESDPRNELKSLLILLITFVCPGFAVALFIAVTWLLRSDAV